MCIPNNVTKRPADEGFITSLHLDENKIKHKDIIPVA